MRSFKFFTLAEWLRLKPVIFLWKELRNDLLLAFYKRKTVILEEDFIQKNQKFQNKKLLIVIAFEQIKVLEWMFSFAKDNVDDFKIMVFDNSRDLHLREQIKQLCSAYKIPYLALPKNLTRHPNRSHGMAMTWVFHRIIQRIEPEWFGFLDHDMIPVQPFYFQEKIAKNMSCYGALNEGNFGYWNLWAGYCFFQYKKYANRPLNFLYDFSRGTDTGGRNWDLVYQEQEKTSKLFAQDEKFQLTLGSGLTAHVQVIDQVWIHVGGVSYNNNLAPKELFYEELMDAFKAGVTFEQLRSP